MSFRLITKQKIALIAVAQALSSVFRADMEGRIARRWRFKSIVFYGSLLAELILFAVLSQPSARGFSSHHSVMQHSN